MFLNVNFPPLLRGSFSLTGLWSIIRNILDPEPYALNPPEHLFRGKVGGQGALVDYLGPCRGVHKF